MRGLGCNKKRVVQIIAHRTREQRQDIIKAFQINFGRDLIKDIKRETGGDLEYALLSLLYTEAEAAAMGIRSAVRGAGTDDTALIALLCTRSNDEIQAITEVYPTRAFGHLLSLLSVRVCVHLCVRAESGQLPSHLQCKAPPPPLSACCFRLQCTRASRWRAM